MKSDYKRMSLIRILKMMTQKHWWLSPKSEEKVERKKISSIWYSTAALSHVAALIPENQLQQELFVGWENHIPLDLLS
ncbi:hypothetical protein FXO38_02784 [Capsicum annuum]|uniref:Uncharacterized protein n=1 Tax=Capsicum annuum TaxID=4072 RepID=A0A2G2ZG44_CAPAN|nr:hypothetical protein FXO38_02784 [Capsicum annuum]KAF3681355.1 hypothetical protein FXO37_02945 [Capsicum annuum]PHT80958.1 hypothetical protein T459_13973 [Capsicum annuum]